jgi:FkbM family methyltransferase
MRPRYIDIRFTAQTVASRIVARLLARAGLRDEVARWRRNRARARRAAAEARGCDTYSRPAQHRMDLQLDAIIGRRNGFFVEAGAHDGFTQSNTYWLEAFRGWRGLLVEPVPELAEQAQQARPGATVVQCALGDAEHERRPLRMEFGGLMSIVAGARDPSWTTIGTRDGWEDCYTFDAVARTLSSILDEIEAPEIDLLSLDVEGFEAPVLRGLDLARHAPRYILVEIHSRANDLPPVETILDSRYAVHGWLSEWDLLYVRRDVVPERASRRLPAAAGSRSATQKSRPARSAAVRENANGPGPPVRARR